MLMNHVSEFTINDKAKSLAQTNSFTPDNYQSKSQTEKELEVASTTSGFQSNYKCSQCSDHLSAVTQAKKR